MVIDTSALYTIIAGEPERPIFIQAIAADPLRLISSFTLFESLVVIHSRLREAGLERFRAFLARTSIEIVPFDARQTETAHAAWTKYGKGRAPAALNLGDCCSYALAKTRSQTLLFKGEDFTLTDIRAAI
jgi:ribonuclease VapC